MPENCPIDELPFRDIDACLSCRYYDNRQRRCYWYSPPKLMEEILSVRERLLLIEKGGGGK